jgi:hypothetical protein
MAESRRRRVNVYVSKSNFWPGGETKGKRCEELASSTSRLLVDYSKRDYHTKPRSRVTTSTRFRSDIKLAVDKN